jgi:AraC-like DNA-binding protein
LFLAVNIGCSATDDTSADEQELVPAQDLMLDPWAYERSPGTEVVQHLTTNLCFQANGVSLLEAGRWSFEFDGAHVSLNRAGDTQTFTVGNSAVRNDPSHPYKLEELSKLVGYHPVHIARTFREFTGKTVGEFVRCARLDLARTLLADNRLSIAEIAQVAGFTDQSHLNRLFRRCFNLTPQEVRRMQNS